MLRDRGDDGNGTPLLAAVGQLQFEVVEYRLKNEYGVDSRMEPLGNAHSSTHTHILKRNDTNTGISAQLTCVWVFYNAMKN